MEILERPVGEIVQRYASAAPLFEKYDIDYCCKGKQTLAVACAKDTIRYEKIVHALHRLIEETNQPVMATDHLTPPELIDYIERKHHTYIRIQSPVIATHLNKILAKHGQRFPFFQEVRVLFDELTMELAPHMLKEERILFPAIRIVFDRQEVQPESHSKLPPVNQPILVMEHEHELAGALMHEIRTLTNNFTPPKNSCQSIHLTYAELQAFEQDLHRHIHLENNILFPAALKMVEKADMLLL